MKNLGQTFVCVSVMISIVSSVEYDINNWDKISFVRQFFFTGLKNDPPEGEWLSNYEVI